MTNSSQPVPPEPRRLLSLADAVSLIVGIVIGTGIFVIPSWVAAGVSSSNIMLLCWVLGGLVSLAGAMCYAELMARFPTTGGDYQFLTNCYGRNAGFVFAWTQFWVVRPGSIGSMAYIFADSAHRIFTPTAGTAWTVAWAIGLISVVTALNVLGLRVGKNTQNLLTFAKVAGLLTVFIAALLAPGATAAAPATEPAESSQQANAESNQAADAIPNAPAEERPTGFWSKAAAQIAMIGGALIFVLFAFGGWTDIAFVGAEVKDPQRNALRAMLIGVTTITVIYLLMNFAYLHVLGFEGVKNSSAVASSTAEVAIGDWGARFVSALILVSSAGALNGIVLTGSRIYYAFGQDHAMFAWLGKWNPRFATPLNSLVVQGVVTCGLTALFGSEFWSKLFQQTGGDFRPADGFERMVYYTTPGYWLFVVLVVLSLFYYRRQPSASAATFRVPGYPVTPILFCLVCLGIIYSSIAYAAFEKNAIYESLWSAGLVGLGVIVSFTSRPPKK